MGLLGLLVIIVLLLAAAALVNLLHNVLYARDRPRRRSAADRLSTRPSTALALADGINRTYGCRTIGFGLFPSEVREFKGHAPFRQVPSIDLGLSKERSWPQNCGNLANAASTWAFQKSDHGLKTAAIWRMWVKH